MAGMVREGIFEGSAARLAGGRRVSPAQAQHLGTMTVPAGETPALRALGEGPQVPSNSARLWASERSSYIWASFGPKKWLRWNN